MKVVTSYEMRGIDRATIKDYGVPGLVLMERAGLAVAKIFIERYPLKRAVILCGGGNNGGDGLVAARELHNSGIRVQVLIAAKNTALSPDCNTQYQIAVKLGVPVEFRSRISVRELHGSVVIDAVFGTGLDRPVKGALAETFRLINASDVPVLSVDMPSGISSDTGEVLGEALEADCSVTFGLPKRGHLLYPGADHTGRLFVEDIGFPAGLLLNSDLMVETVERGFVSGLVPQRQKNSHKGDYGHVLVIAGSRGKTGAALMSAMACLRSGAGLVTIGIPESLTGIFQSRVTEEMILPLPDNGEGMLSAKAVDKILEFASSKVDVIAVGPGIGVSGDTEIMTSMLIRQSPVPVVMDADAINSLNSNKNILNKAKSPVILTPHRGEMARLLGQKTAFGSKAAIDMVSSFARKTGVYLVLKGAPTLIGEPEGRVFINTTGNPGMATAGSGDALTGVISSLLGQGLNPLEASVLGVYIHGLSGDLAASEKGEYSLIASDIIDSLPSAFLKLG